MEPTASLHYASVDGNGSPSAGLISRILVLSVGNASASAQSFTWFRWVAKDKALWRRSGKQSLQARRRTTRSGQTCSRQRQGALVTESLRLVRTTNLNPSVAGP